VLPPNVLSAFRTKLETVLRRNGCMHDKKFKNRLHLDDVVLECFSTLSPKCRDEELEDLAYFVLDLFQLHGAQVAVSEIDMDQVLTLYCGLFFCPSYQHFSSAGG
jgi:separase